MATQQMISPPARAAIFLVLTVPQGSEAKVKEVLADISGLTRSVAFRVSTDDLIAVVGIGSRVWDRIFPGHAKPRHLRPFETIAGAVHTAPATEGDLLIHLRATSLDLAMELARLVLKRLSGHASVIDEVHGFKFFDERDILGFVDGTENPEGQAAVRSVLVTDDDPNFRGGSYVIVQKYLHDMAAWEALSVEQQEAAIGRSKLQDVEFPDEDKAPNAHTVLTVIEDADGTQHQIMRDNMPFGTLADDQMGTYFIGYAADPGVTELMLRRMFIGQPEGTYDRILDFSTATTGALFFAPPLDFLDNPPG